MSGTVTRRGVTATAAGRGATVAAGPLAPARARTGAVAEVRIERRTGGNVAALDDAIAVEEPLEIRVRHAGGAGCTVAVTMRTPGRDADLAVGFLHGEGLLVDPADVLDVAGCATAANVVHVTLAGHASLEPFTGTRRFYTTSSCGLCGRSSLDAVFAGLRGRRIDGAASVSRATLCALPRRVRERQAAFERTGGLHGAALVATDGTLLDLAEDVGRHNAVDKLVGRAWRSGELPATDRVLFLSGRAGFELVQKAVMAGVSVVAAIGAPTSLAVELARESGLTLVGFLQPDRCNVYAHAERLDG
jgi:FdhD protein